jgi:DNA-binding transcriptional regulator YiaG
MEMKTAKKSAAANSVPATTSKSSGIHGTNGVSRGKLQTGVKEVADVRKLSRKYNLSNEAVSRVTGASPRTVSYWNSGTPPQRSRVQKIREVTRLFDALAELIKAKAIGPWMQQPNPAFDGSTPLQVIERGETDRLWRMIWHLREGNPG